jgi:hypothetical protein
VDGLTPYLKDPKAFFDVLTGPKYDYKLKGIGPIKYHLSGDFDRDKDGTLWWGSKTYVKRRLRAAQGVLDSFGEGRPL